MHEPWYLPQTKQEKADYDRVCGRLYKRFGSYPKIAAQLTGHDNHYISAQTVRVWFRDRKIPAHYAMLLAAVIDANPYHLLPWLKAFVDTWEAHKQRDNKHERKSVRTNTRTGRVLAPQGAPGKK